MKYLISHYDTFYFRRKLNYKNICISLKTKNKLEAKFILATINAKLEAIKLRLEMDSIEEVEYAILESSGTLSVFPYKKETSPLPLPIILDGDIQEDTLKHLKKDKKWVYNFLDKKDINIEDVFFAFYKDKNIFIIKNDDLLK